MDDEATIELVLSSMPDCRRVERCSIYGTTHVVADSDKVRAFAASLIGKREAERLLLDIVFAYQDELDHREFLRTGRTPLGWC